MSIGIKNLMLIVEGVAGLGTIAGDVFADKKVSISDLGAIMKLIPVLQAFTAVDYKELGAELKDLDQTELAQLKLKLEQNFDLPAELDSVEKQIEAIVGIAMKLAAVIQESIALFKKKA